MPRTGLSDQEFINIWNQHHSAAAVAKHTGIAERRVHARRRAIEKRHDISLHTVDFNRHAYDQSMLVTADRVEVKLQIKNGVVLVAGDQHYHPGNIPTMHRAFCLLSKQLKPFAQIWNGDAFDGATISRHPSIGWENKPAVKDELQTVQERSDEIIKACPQAKRIWCAGNHDLRLESKIAAVAPEMRGVKGVHLKDFFDEWQPAWFVTVNDGEPSHTEIRHREKGGIHAGYNNTKESGVNIVTGHDHRAEVVPYDDRRGRRYAVRHGMTADSCRDQPFVNYMEGRKVNWQSAFAVLTYRDGVLLCPELALRLDENHFQFRGEIIKC